MVFRGAKRGQWREIGDLLYCQCPLYNYYKTMLVILKSICKATFSIDLNHNFIIHVSVYNSENHSSLLSIKHCLLKLHETKIHKCNTSVILHQIKIQKSDLNQRCWQVVFTSWFRRSKIGLSFKQTEFVLSAMPNVNFNFL